MEFARLAGIVLLSLVILIAFAWAFGALLYDGSGKVFAVLTALAVPALFVFVKRWRLKLTDGAAALTF